MERVHQKIRREHHETVRAVVSAAESVASAIEPRPVTDGEAIRRPLEALLRSEGLLDGLTALLRTGADALGADIRGTPVAAPPYLVVTSTGPVCRATLADGRRLVIELPVFAVERRPRRYRFLGPEPADCLRVRLV